jgi:hypothetical protein
MLGLFSSDAPFFFITHKAGFSMWTNSRNKDHTQSFAGYRMLNCPTHTWPTFIYMINSPTDDTIGTL